MKVLSKLDSLDNIQDGETRKLITKAESSGSGNIITNLSVSGDTIEYTKGTLQPLETKTYTDIIGVTDNTDANCAFFFGSVRPESFTKTWAVKYRIHVWCESNANYNAVADVFFEGAQSGLASYAVFNNIYNTSYRPVYYHSMYRLTQTGYNANYGHALGFSLRDSNERLTTSLMRTVKIELLEYRNCTVTLNDEAVKWADWPGTGTTNYGSISSYNFSGNGLQETGDANDNTVAYQIRTNSGIWANKTGYNTNRYTLLFEVVGGLSGAATSIGTSTSKTTVAFKYIPKGVIKYNTTNASVANNANISATGLWDQYAIDLRNTFNIGSTLVSGKPVYMRCVVNSDGTLTPNYAGSPSHPIVQTLPTTADGYAYVYLGQAYSTTSMELRYDHPIYEYKDGKIREWQYDSGGTISDVKVNNTSIVSSGVANLVTESAYNSSSNKIATKNDIPTNNNQLTNGAGYITGITSNDVTTALGYTPYNSTNPNGYTSNTGTITKVQANGTDVASSGTANIPAATTSKYGVTELSSATNSTSEVLAATPKAVKAAYDLAASKGTGTITGVSVNGTSVATSGVANITSVPASILSGAIPSAVTATTQTQGDNSTKIATTAYVDTAIDNLPDPMVFKGSLGTGGTITTLPVNGSANIGDTYKVITAGTYASKAAKVGDTFICLTKTSNANTWELIPSGDEPGGTVTSVKINATGPIAIDSNAAITTSGERTISHSNSGVTAGTYKSVTVNATGHITAGTNPTTLSGYGITDAKIDNGVITLGSNTITPIIDTSDKVSKSGDTMSGDLTIQKATPRLTIKSTDTTDAIIRFANSNYTRDCITASNASVNGYNLTIDSGGRTILGSGESGAALATALGKNQDAETLYLVSDQQIFFDSNGQTITSRKGFELLNSGDLVPTVADVATTDKGSLGTASYQWENVYSKVYHVDKQVAIEYNSTDKCIEFNFE